MGNARVSGLKRHVVPNFDSPKKAKGSKSMPETTKTCQVKMNDGKPCGRELTIMMINISRA